MLSFSFKNGRKKVKAANISNIISSEIHALICN